MARHRPLARLMVSRALAVAGVLVLLVGAVAVAWLAGDSSAPPDEFDWGVAAEVGIAFATVALAGVTAVLALSTRRLAQDTKKLAAMTNLDATATQELVKLTRQAQQREIEPYLVVTTQVTIAGTKSPSTGLEIASLEGAAWDLEFTIQNIGLGPALDVFVYAFHRTRDGGVAEEKFVQRGPAIGARDRHTDQANLSSMARTIGAMPQIGGTYVDRDGNPPDRFRFGYSGVMREYRPAAPPGEDTDASAA